ncbi:TPA: phage tail protein [Escherichia coli]|nr:phage tail protein [Escherichia coli]
MARLADFSNDEGVCWPSIETIARQIGAGMSTVRTAIARLEAEGWLTRKARRQGNRVASSAISQSASQVARETKVRRKLVKERARLKRATVKNPQARIKVNRGDLPVIKLGNARVVLSRRRRRKKGQRSSLKGGGSVLVVGNRRIPGAFIQQLKNGRWHVMQRVAGKNRYPIDVVKIPMAVPLTTAFKQNIERIRRERLPKELGYALQHQLRMVIKR